MKLVSESALIPYGASFPPGRRWLVLAPHPDDETFGPGATLARAARDGISVEVVIVTDGAAQGDAATRELEAAAAARELGLQPPRFCRLPDRGLDPNSAELRTLLVETLTRQAPELVLVTSPVELHPDHRALALALQRAVRRTSAFGVRARGPAWIAAYEVGTPLRPNLLVDAGQAWEAKRAAARRYASQLEFRPYHELVEALGALRTLTLPGTTRAEALHVLPASTVARLSARAWARRMGSDAGVRG